MARGFGDIDLSPVIGRRPVPGPDYLTVTVPTPDPASSGLPVLVFLHGGGFQTGTGSAALYDGTGFARDGVVLVTLNYRLGIPGWLHLPGAPANRGLLDALAALRWVRENVAAFGGDPATVTVAGQSAGAMIVTALLALAAAEGLFARAVSQSGGDGCVVPGSYATESTRWVATELGIPATAQDFAELDDPLLMEVAARMPLPDPVAHGFLDTSVGGSPFKLVIDGELLTNQPVDALTTGPGRRVDLLVGSTADEANLYLVPSRRWAETEDTGLLTAARRRFAAPEERVARARSDHPGRTAGELTSILITEAFIDGTRRLTEAHAAQAGRTYAYEFRWRSGAFDGRLGACHGVELPFVFDRTELEDLRGEHALLGPASPRSGLANRTHAAWVAFAATGDPGWTPYTAREPITMAIDEVWKEFRSV